ncbi:HET-domain-containing protein [Aulographum hederae CBS 113979]|uniref:HET-domain-containing protein n=1 Tax=Aulographum hederae CBS 113979 TaxID=1176131 RepID=A0A6G1HB06_9PEZI|nr:HET-domain-containing protein [Aulographum hederae CBS 113979]
MTRRTASDVLRSLLGILLLFNYYFFFIWSGAFVFIGIPFVIIVGAAPNSPGWVYLAYFFGFSFVVLVALFWMEMTYGIHNDIKAMFRDNVCDSTVVGGKENYQLEALSPKQSLIVPKTDAPFDPTNEPVVGQVQATSITAVNLSSPVYSPLGDTEIRLLKFSSSDASGDVLDIELIHLPLLSAGARGYAALSYTWGLEPPDVNLRLNKTDFKVRPSLERILRRICRLGYDLLWVDAICINQNDRAECSAQVLRMSGIFATARPVLVPFNMAEEHTNRLIHITSLINIAIKPEKQGEQVAELSRDGQYQTAVQAFCAQQYWKRMWIIQEFVVGHPVIFLLGAQAVHAEKIMVMMRIFHEQLDAPENKPLETVFRFRERWQKERKQIFLLDALCDTKNSLCSNRHDRVFALLGLVSDGLDFVFETNYSATLDELSLSMARSCIMRQSLSNLLIGACRKEDSVLPSWCPDWFHFDMQQPNRYPSQWHATRRTRENLTISSTIIKTSAHFLGAIQSLGYSQSDVASTAYPKHNPVWHENCQVVGGKARLWFGRATSGTYRERQKSRTMRNRAYCWRLLFHPKYDVDPGVQSQKNNLAQWLRSNREFCAGGRKLLHHATRADLSMESAVVKCSSWLLKPARLRHRRLRWLPGGSPPHPFDIFKEIVLKNLRLMCLEDASYGIGWAHEKADLNDHVFLIPGCSMPVILRVKPDRWTIAAEYFTESLLS